MVLGTLPEKAPIVASKFAWVDQRGDQKGIIILDSNLVLRVNIEVNQDPPVGCTIQIDMLKSTKT